MTCVKPYVFFGFCFASGWLFECRLSAAELQYPLDVATDADGNIYVADRYLPGIWQVSQNELKVLHTGSKRFRAPMNAVRCVAVNSKGQVFAGDSATRDVYRINNDGTATPLTNGQIGIPMSIAFDSDDNLLVCDLELHRIFRVPSDGGDAEEFATVAAPRCIVTDDNDRVWVLSHGKNQVVRLSADGKQQTVVVSGRPFQFANQLLLGPSDVLFVSDGYADAIWRCEPGKPPEKWLTGEPFEGPVGLAWQKENLLIADPQAKAVFSVSPKKEVTRVAK